MTTVIYGLADPATHEIRYIGKSRSIAERIRGHAWESRHLQTRKARWLRSLGREPEVMVLAELDEADDWEGVERTFIALYRDIRPGRLTNFASGGQTSPVEGIGHTDEAKAKMRAAAIRNGARPPSRKGVPVSAETRERLKAASLQRGARPPMRGGWNKGRKATPEEIEKNRLGHLGKPWTPSRRAAQQLVAARKVVTP